MTEFANILIFQPAAIGDVMLATPVAKTLKLNYPGAKITFWGHPSLRELLIELCPYMDEYIDYERPAGFISLLKTFWSVQCDLYVDLSNSTKGLFSAAFSSSNMRVLGYRKQSDQTMEKVHAAENFLATVSPVCEELPAPLFPTIFPDVLATRILSDIFMDKPDKLLIGLIPGVGKLRPHRAWIADGWRYLISALLDQKDCLPVLIGGKDEIELSDMLMQEYEDRCLNLTGKLELVQTAAVLKLCKVVISGDTGPAHMAVAVGTPVIGLYGPTYPARSGPYSCDNLLIDQSKYCRCHRLKFCNFVKKDEPGECMHRIMLPEILEKLKQVLSTEQPQKAPEQEIYS